MANIVGITPRVVSSADGSVVAGQIHIYGFRLVPAAAAASCTVQDDNGNTIWVGSAAASSLPDQTFFPTPLAFNGHKVSAIAGAGAALHIYMV
jgi:hypothetical protein